MLVLAQQLLQALLLPLQHHLLLLVLVCECSGRVEEARHLAAAAAAEDGWDKALSLQTHISHKTRVMVSPRGKPNRMHFGAFNCISCLLPCCTTSKHMLSGQPAAPPPPVTMLATLRYHLPCTKVGPLAHPIRSHKLATLLALAFCHAAPPACLLPCLFTAMLAYCHACLLPCCTTSTHLLMNKLQLADAMHVYL
jgi:hypothetical protein